MYKIKAIIKSLLLEIKVYLLTLILILSFILSCTTEDLIKEHLYQSLNIFISLNLIRILQTNKNN